MSAGCCQSCTGMIGDTATGRGGRSGQGMVRRNTFCQCERCSSAGVFLWSAGPQAISTRRQAPSAAGGRRRHWHCHCSLRRSATGSASASLTPSGRGQAALRLPLALARAAAARGGSLQASSATQACSTLAVGNLSSKLTCWDTPPCHCSLQVLVLSTAI
jgi:hypothetical protein